MKQIVKKIGILVLALILSSSFVLSTNAQDALSKQETEDSGLRAFASKLFEYEPEYELEDLCNCINGEAYTSSYDIEQIMGCHTFASMMIDAHYEELSKERAALPEYLVEAKATLDASKNIEQNTRSATNDFVYSDNYLFKVYYDQINHSAAHDTAEFTADIFEMVYEDICEPYDIAMPTTDGTYYEIHLMYSEAAQESGYDIGDNATIDTYKTISYGNGRSKIIMLFDVLYEYMCEIQSSYVVGAAAHEFMHALIHSFDIHSISLEYRWFHESLATAAGIIYEEQYANERGRCRWIQSFISAIDESIPSFTGGDDGEIRNGSGLFYIYLYDYLGGWSPIFYMLEEYEDADGIVDMIDTMLDWQYGSSFEEEFRWFLNFCVDPDEFFPSSPKTRLGSSGRTWGSPDFKMTTNIGSSAISGVRTFTLQPLSVHFLKFTSNSSIIMELNTRLQYTRSNTNMEVPGMFYHYYNAATGNWEWSGLNTTSPFSCLFDVCNSAVNEVYIVIVNPNISGTISYTCNYSSSVKYPDHQIWSINS